MKQNNILKITSICFKQEYVSKPFKQSIPTCFQRCQLEDWCRLPGPICEWRWHPGQQHRLQIVPEGAAAAHAGSVFQARQGNLLTLVLAFVLLFADISGHKNLIQQAQLPSGPKCHILNEFELLPFAFGLLMVVPVFRTQPLRLRARNPWSWAGIEVALWKVKHW